MIDGMPLQRSVGLGFRTAAATLRRLPGPLAYGLADAVTPLLVLLALHRERRVAPQGRGLLRNQRIVFRDGLTAGLSRRLLFGWARHMSHLVVDFCRMPRIHPGNIDRYVDTRDVEKVRAVLAGGRGVVCVTGHIGVWELAGHVLAVRDVPVRSVARPLANPFLDAAVNSVRGAGGQKILAQRGAVRALKRELEQGQPVGILADEDARRRPVFAPFLGTDAATSRGAALLQRATGAPIAVVTCHRTARERFRFRLWRVIEPAPTRDRDADLRAVTHEINAALSEAILHRPEQWLWGSRRFVTRPRGEAAGADGLPPPTRDPAGATPVAGGA